MDRGFKDVIWLVVSDVHGRGKGGREEKGEKLTRPTRELVSEAAHASIANGERNGRATLLDHEGTGNRRGIDPLVLFVQDLECLDFGLLPQDREALRIGVIGIVNRTQRAQSR